MSITVHPGLPEEGHAPHGGRTPEPSTAAGAGIGPHLQPGTAAISVVAGTQPGAIANSNSALPGGAHTSTSTTHTPTTTTAVQRRRHLTVPNLNLDHPRQLRNSNFTGPSPLATSAVHTPTSATSVSGLAPIQEDIDIDIDDAEPIEVDPKPAEHTPTTTPHRRIAPLPRASGSTPTTTTHTTSSSSAASPRRPTFPPSARNFPFAFLMSAPSTPLAPRAHHPSHSHHHTGSYPSQLAHKSAHYLHTIPPSEKTTRTLILDHVLWKHGKARFAQARAELGLKVLKEDEEDDDLPGITEEGGEDAAVTEEVDALGYRSSTSSAARRVVLGPGDPGKAKVLKTQADGHENVLSAMLEQPPEVQYGQWDSPAPPADDAHTKAPSLPNGVRVRLTLTSLVNDFFARDEDPVIVSRGAYPPSITQLQLISNPCAPASTLPTLPSLADLLNSSPAPATAASSTAAPGQREGGAKPTSIWAAVPRGLGMDAPWAFAGTLQPPPAPSSSNPASSSPSASGSNPQPPPSDWPKLNAPASSSPAARAIALYNAGALAPLNPIQCARHLTPCNCLTGPTQTAHTQGQGSRHIGAGLRRPSSQLLRRRNHLLSSALGGERALPTSRLTDLLPRFVRLSALVAIELGREAAAGAAEESTRGSVAGDTNDSASPYASDAEADGTGMDEDRATPLQVPARPSRAWYALLCTLCTRACLEGYLARGWRGTEGVETLFGLGVDLAGLDQLWDDDAATTGAVGGAGGAGSDSAGEDDDDEDSTRGMDPDGWPTLEEAARVLFPAVAAGEEGAGTQGEYEAEMRGRRDLFLNVPSNTTDLRSHLMDLAGRYPPEPMERAALRFCEAVSRWRGRPELFKPQKTSRTRSTSIASNTSQSALSITSLINHPASPPRPPIERWFVVPSRSDRRRPLAVRSALGKGKRKRTTDADSLGAGGAERKGKGKKVDRGDANGYVGENDWVDPYGITN